MKQVVQNNEDLIIRIITLKGYNEERRDEQKFINTISKIETTEPVPEITEEFVDDCLDYYTVGVNSEIIDSNAVFRAIYLVSEHLDELKNSEYSNS